jgi:peptidoglycan/xylan/chitin deacetylase (PgdA/CDA1 family)
VGDVDADPLGLTVTADRFRDHLEVLRDEADVVPLERVFERTERGRSVAVTFDDGYADNVEVAVPLLVRSDVPATFFVVAGDPAEEFWWDRLDHLLAAPTTGAEQIDVTISGRRLRADVRTQAARAQARRALNHRIRVLHPDSVETVLARIAEQLGPLPPSCVRHRRATLPQLRELDATPGMTIGSHTRRHAMLGGLPESEQERELADARIWLEHEIGIDVTSVAYPFGMPGSWDRRTERLVRSAGYQLACTNVVGIVRRRTPPHRLPRCQVWNHDAGDLRVRLRGWLAGDR